MELNPQPNSLPSAVIARVCRNPQAIFTTSSLIGTCTGVECLVWKKGATACLFSPPYPHYPKVSSPIAQTWPFRSSPMKWSLPVAIIYIGGRFLTRIGWSITSSPEKTAFFLRKSPVLMGGISLMTKTYSFPSSVITNIRCLVKATWRTLVFAGKVLTSVICLLPSYISFSFLLLIFAFSHTYNLPFLSM